MFNGFIQYELDIDISINSFLNYLRFLIYTASIGTVRIDIIEKNIKTHNWFYTNQINTYGKIMHQIRCRACGIDNLVLRIWTYADDRYLWEPDFIKFYVEEIIKNNELSCDERIIRDIIK